MIERRFQDSVVEIRATLPDGSERVGSGARVGPDLVLTAYHVAGDRENRLLTAGPCGVTFRRVVDGRVTDKVESAVLVVDDGGGPVGDGHLDFLLLRRAPGSPAFPDWAPPLPLATLSDADVDPDARPSFAAFGFPDSNPDGILIEGRILALAIYDGAETIQLQSDTARDLHIRGMSGAAVISGGHMVGVIRATLLGGDGKTSGGQLYACPIRPIAERDSRLVPAPLPPRRPPPLPQRPLPPGADLPDLRAPAPPAVEAPALVVGPLLEALAAAVTKTEMARSAAMVKAAAYAGLVHQELLKQKADVANDHFQAQRYVEAQAAYQEILLTAERLAVAAPDDDELRQWIARSRLNVAGCSLCLQSPDGRDRLRDVAERYVDYLKPAARAQLAMSLAQTGELDLARRVLPDGDTSEDVVAARQLIELKSGRLPDPPWASASVLRMHVAGALVDQGRLEEGARLARELIAEEPDDVLLVFYCLATLELALRKSVHDEPSQGRPIPIGERAATVEAIERHIDDLDRLPAALAGDLRRLRFSYYHLTVDEERRQLAAEALGEDYRAIQSERSRYDLALVKAEGLAREGKLDEALALVPPTSHPWQGRFDRAQLLAVALQFDDALAEAADLARVWPGRAPIEHLLAELRAHGPHPEEALSHARAAFAALPGRGFRLLLGRCLLAAGQAGEAWSTLAPLVGSRNEAFLRARAIAAERLPEHAREAPAYWRDYLEVRSDDDAIRLRIARLQYQAGDPDSAAVTAREVLARGKDRLDAQSLFDCARILRARGRLDEQTRADLREIADVLHTRFRGDATAEHYRFVLLRALGFPEDAKPVDYASLVTAGVLRPVPLEEMEAALEGRQRLRDMVYGAYRMGHIPFESLCALTETAAARYLVRFAHVASDRGPPVLSTPVALGDGLPVLDLAGRRILVGEIELLLLERFALWRRFRARLGEKGKLVLFADVWARVIEAAVTLEQSTQRVTLEEQGKLLHLLTNSPGRIRPEEEPPAGPDGAWAESRGLPIVDDEGSDRAASPISLRTLVAHLDERGYLDPEKVERLSRMFQPENEAARRASLGALPERLCLSYGALQQLFEAGALDALLQIDGLTLVVGPDAMATVRGRHRMLSEDVEAADLAAAAHRAVGAGIAEDWIDVSLPRPVIADLPDVLDQPHRDHARRVIREPLEVGLSFRQALIDDPELLILAADYFLTSEIGSHHREILRLAWPSPAVALDFISRMRPPHDREIHLPALVRYLLQSEEVEARNKLIDLARLGFTEALGPDDLLALNNFHGGLDRQRPKEILDRVEWMVSEPDHLGASMAFLRLADVYGKVIWQAFCGEQRLPEAKAKLLAFSLLNRAERIGDQWAGTMVDLIVQFAAGLVAGKPVLAIKEPEQGARVAILSVDSPGGRLWSCFAAWAGPEGDRRAAYGRAVRALWLLMDELAKPDGPNTVQAAGLLLASGVGALSMLHPEIAAPAILSANWKERPLTGIHPPGEKEESIEGLLARGADLQRSHPTGIPWNESMMVFESFPDPQGNPSVLPAEAVLLRARSQKALENFAQVQGPHDGRAYRQLVHLAKDPDNDDLRRELARAAIRAPWRLVRDNPAIIRAWGWHHRSGLGDTVSKMSLHRMREMLSEPPGALDNEKSLWDTLGDRTHEGNAWADRDDRVELGLQASEVPGFLPALMATTRLRFNRAGYIREVAEALDRLEHPHEQPAATLAGDIFFLRVAAECRPHVTLPGGEIDLRERLQERFGAVLCSVMEAPPPDTLAEAEAALLRLCGEVVQELSLPAGFRQIKDWLWLTYRLFQWLVTQLRAMAPDAQKAGLISLRKLSPKPGPLAPEANDLLNPFRFDRFDHRLATVLYALGAMEELPARIKRAPDDEKETARGVTSTALEEPLVRLAAKPLTEEERSLRSRGDRPSCFDWYGPGAIPDLALQALLQINPGALVQMPEEARLRWLVDVPRNSQDKERLHWPLALRLLSVLADNAQHLSAAEKVALEERLRALEGEVGQVVRWLGFNRLYGAGCVHLEGEVRDMLLENLSAPVAPEAFGGYLAALSFVAPERLQAEVERVLAAVEAQASKPDSKDGGQEVPAPLAFAWGVGAVIAAGEPGSISVAQSILRALAARDPYRGTEPMRQLFGLLGLT